MPRMQVYLPDDLYAEVKQQGLPASELLQDAVREQMRKRKLIEEGDKYLEELQAEVGPSTPESKAWAEKIIGQVVRHSEQTAS
ncbi:MAG: hypothetical protein OXF00_09775 [bacterium]|nr:hypothetical protein [bacterium]